MTSNGVADDRPWDTRAAAVLWEVGGALGRGTGAKRPSNAATVRSGARFQRCWVKTTPGQRLWGGIDNQADVPSDVLKVAEEDAFRPDPVVEVITGFEDTHWGTKEMTVRDLDGRIWSLQTSTQNPG